MITLESSVDFIVTSPGDSSQSNGHDYFIITSLVDLSQSNGHDDFTEKSPNDDHIKILMKLIKKYHILAP